MMFWIGPAAYAGVTVHTALNTVVPEPDSGITWSCGADVPIAAGVALRSEDVFAQSPLLWRAERSGNSFPFVWREPPTVDLTADEGVYYESMVVCADEQLAACVTTVETAEAPGPVDEKTVYASCPDGLFAMNGGFGITGDPTGVAVVESHSVGLLAPTGWKVSAREYHSSAGSWGIDAEVRCVTADTLGELVESGPDAVSKSLGLYPNDYLHWTTTATFDGSSFLTTVSTSVRSSWEGLVSAGPSWDDDWAAGTAAYHSYDFEEGETNVLETWILQASDEEGLALALDCTVHPEVPDEVIRRFRVGGWVTHSVAVGAKGWHWLPGVGPVPVDPEPFHVAFEALPVAVGYYDDGHELGERLDTIHAELALDHTPFSDVAEVERTLGTAETTFVVPTDEAAAVRWLSDHRAELDRLDHTTLLFLATDGLGAELLAEW